MATMKQIKEFLDMYALNTSGYRKINGGYADTDIDHITRNKDGTIRVQGYIISGKEDMGDGHSEKYTDEMDVMLKEEKGKLSILRKVE
jgi:hypothetical protein